MKSTLLSFFLLVVGGRVGASLTARNTVDQCASVNEDLYVPWQGHPIKFGHITDCLCLSSLPSYVHTNPYASQASEFCGQGPTIDALAGLITSSPSHDACSYPPHSVPQCTNYNPCGFDCTDGYTPESPWGGYPTECVCVWPKKECNGKCGDYKSCSSKRAVSGELDGLLKREVREVSNRDIEKRGPMMDKEKRERTMARGKRLGEKLGCPKGWEACGVFGGSRQSWECVDTTNDLESCGGCTIPLSLPPSMSRSSSFSWDDVSFGIDCTALPGVTDVECRRGACVVRRCSTGWIIARDGDRCIRARDAKKVDDAEADEGRWIDDSAGAWGLEHVPLGGTVN